MPCAINNHLSHSPKEYMYCGHVIQVMNLCSRREKAYNNNVSIIFFFFFTPATTKQTLNMKRFFIPRTSPPTFAGLETRSPASPPPLLALSPPAPAIAAAPPPPPPPPAPRPPPFSAPIRQCSFLKLSSGSTPTRRCDPGCFMLKRRAYAPPPPLLAAHGAPPPSATAASRPVTCSLLPVLPLLAADAAAPATGVEDLTGGAGAQVCGSGAAREDFAADATAAAAAAASEDEAGGWADCGRRVCCLGFAVLPACQVSTARDDEKAKERAHVCLFDLCFCALCGCRVRRSAYLCFIDRGGPRSVSTFPVFSNANSNSTTHRKTTPNSTPHPKHLG